jgi:uncharacterized protein YndB with AHSA1/START domain
MNARTDVPAEPRSSAALRRSTGRDRADWFGLLDTWGAAGRPYREIADWLTGDHGLSKWWAQKLIVEYEEARGLRDPGIRPDGTFEVGASKTVAVPLGRAFAAFTDAKLRARWLPGVAVRTPALDPDRSIRFDWTDGGGRVAATFSARGAGKTVVVVQHQRLADARTAAKRKAYWRERLAAFKALLEGTVRPAK